MLQQTCPPCTIHLVGFRASLNTVKCLKEWGTNQHNDWVSGTLQCRHINRQVLQRRSNRLNELLLLDVFYFLWLGPVLLGVSE